MVAFIALFVALSGVGYTAAKINGKNLKNRSVTAKKVKKNTLTGTEIKNGAVQSNKIANGAVTSDKIAGGAVTSDNIANKAITSGKVFFSSVTTLNFGTILAEACSSLPVPAAGISATDHALVTPPPGFPDTFTLTGKPEPSTNTVVFAACNTFIAGGADPDGGGGGPYKLLVIR